MVTKIYLEIERAFATVKLHTFMAASHKFGRGLAVKKLEEVILAPLEDFVEKYGPEKNEMKAKKVLKLDEAINMKQEKKGILKKK